MDREQEIEKLANLMWNFQTIEECAQGVYDAGYRLVPPADSGVAFIETPQTIDESG